MRAGLDRLARSGNAGPVFALLRRPEASGLLRCLSAELYGQGDPTKLDAWLSELTAIIAAELALTASDALPAGGMHLAEPPRHLHVPAAGIVVETPPGTDIGVLPGRLRLQRVGAAGEVDLANPGQHESLPQGCNVVRARHPIRDRMALVTVDNNPLSDREAHPDKRGNAIDLGGEPCSRWCDVLGEAIDTIDAHLPDLGDELRLVMQNWVPVGADPQQHLSASYGEVIGTAYLSLHPDRATMLEAVVHEFSHNKLNVLWALDGVLENAFHPRFSSPVRPDPRPLHGIMLAVHAFVPVALLYERLREADHALSRKPGFSERFRTIVRGNRDGIATLVANARPTPAGRAVIEELARWDEHFAHVDA